MIADVKHRTSSGHCKTNSARVDAPTREQLLAHPDAPALIEKFRANTHPDWDGRDEHAELVTTLILRVRHAAHSTPTTNGG